MSYKIGQRRFSGVGSCMTEVSGITKSTQAVSMSSSDSEGSFQDVKIVLDGTNSFDPNTDYYLHLNIPCNVNYNMTFNIKLVKLQTTTVQTYQFIRQVKCNRGGSSDFVHPVALYDASSSDDSPDIRVQTPIPEKDASKVSEIGKLYVEETRRNGVVTSTYYIGSGVLNGYNRTDKVNVVQIPETWRSGTSTEIKSSFDMVFRPVEEGFTAILLEMIRNNTDYSIKTSTTVNGETVTQYGRTVTPDSVDVSLYTLANQVTQIAGASSDTKLTRIGVWSHPGLMMAVNGEEIRVGSGGFYEEDVVPITSLGIASKDYSDNWTMDYILDNTTTTSEAGV